MAPLGKPHKKTREAEPITLPDSFPTTAPAEPVKVPQPAQPAPLVPA